MATSESAQGLGQIDAAGAAEEVLRRQAERAKQPGLHITRPTKEQLETDEHTRKAYQARNEAHEKQSEQMRRLHSATGNAFARQGLNSQDIVKAVGLLRDDVPFEKVKKLMPEVSVKALEDWRPELERRAKLPPGGERILLTSSPKAPHVVEQERKDAERAFAEKQEQARKMRESGFDPEA